MAEAEAEAAVVCLACCLQCRWELEASRSLLTMPSYPSSFCSETFEAEYNMQDPESVARLHATLRPHLLRRVIKDVEKVRGRAVCVYVVLAWACVCGSGGGGNQALCCLQLSPCPSNAALCPSCAALLPPPRDTACRRACRPRTSASCGWA